MCPFHIIPFHYTKVGLEPLYIYIGRRLGAGEAGGTEERPKKTFIKVSGALRAFWGSKGLTPNLKRATFHVGKMIEIL